MMKNRFMKKKGIIIFTFVYVIVLAIIISSQQSKKIVITKNSNIYAKPANEAFDDDNFYKCVVDQYNSDNSKKISYNTKLSNKKLESITELSCGYRIIKSAKGIDKLTKLEELYLSSNQLTSIDLSKNTKLKELVIYENQLTSIDLSKNTKLKKLVIYENQLTNVDLSKNTKLELLSVSENQLTSIDLSKNTKLKSLSISENQLTSIDLSENTKLKSLSVSENQLTSIDLSENTKLESLSVSENQLTSINLSKNTNLRSLYVEKNELTNLDLSNNFKLKFLVLSENHLTRLDVSKNIKLRVLDASYNQLTSLDVSKNTNLRVLDAFYNQLTSLDVSKNTKLEKLNAYIYKKIATYKNKNKLVIDTPANLKFDKPPSGFDFKNNKLLVDRSQIGNISAKGKKYINDNSYYNLTYNIYIIEAISMNNNIIIDKDKEKIYIKGNYSKQTIINNIQLNIGTKEIKNNKFIIKYNDKIVKEFKLVYKVSSVSLDQTSIDMKKNTTVQLNATVSPKNATNKSVIWTSDNNLVATVSDKGLVTAKNAGSAVITVTTDDGKKTAQAKINVERPDIVDDGIPRLNIYTYNSKSISDGQYAPINPSGLEYKVYNTKVKCEQDIDGASVNGTVNRTSWNIFAGEKNTKLDNNSLYMEAKIFGAPVGTVLYIRQTKALGYELNNECKGFKVGETQSITFANEPSKNNNYYNIKIDNSMIKTGKLDIKTKFYSKEKVSIYDAYQEIKKDDYIFLGWRIQRKTDNKYMCYKDQNHTSFDWLDEDNCGNGIILLQNNGDLSSYLINIKNKETIILKSDWKVPSTIKIELKDTNNQEYKRHATVMLYNDKKQCLQDFQTNTYQQAKAASSIEQGQYGWISKNSQKSNDIETNDGIISIKKQLSDKKYYLLILNSNYYQKFSSNCIEVKANESKTIKLIPKKFKINYNLSGGTGTLKTSEKTVDKDVTVKVKDLKYANYKFNYWKAQRNVDNKTEYRCYNKDNKKGWFTAKDCHSYIKYGSNAKDFNMTINTPNDSITFIAQWIK